MNCKQCDWAIVVRSRLYPEMIGWVVRCKQQLEGVNAWFVEPELPSPIVSIADCNLKPLASGIDADEIARRLMRRMK